METVVLFIKTAPEMIDLFVLDHQLEDATAYII